MDIIDRKTFILNEIENDVILSLELKKRFQKQISEMSDDELGVFVESLREAREGKDLRKKILQLQAVEKEGQANFLQTANEFLGKITKHESQKQEDTDKARADTILNKIKSL